MAKRENEENQKKIGDLRTWELNKLIRETMYMEAHNGKLPLLNRDRRKVVIASLVVLILVAFIDFFGVRSYWLSNTFSDFNLVESVSIGIDRIQRGWQSLRKSIDYKRATHIDPDDAKVLIYDAFDHRHLHISLFSEVSQEFETTPDSTLWSLENNFTESFKKLKPISQFKAAAKLPGLLDFQLARIHKRPPWAA
ncbi:MAG: hypothetical protein IPK01_00630 [Acidobacteria bacterium]|nr:hypothetical protein [Acidobacteriota bacterium]